jgi:5-dehydro-2-deoxygluconokinase
LSQSLDVLTVGRVGVDLYAEEVGASFTDARRFQKSIGGGALAVEPSRGTTRELPAARGPMQHTILDLDYRPSFWTSPEEARRQTAKAIDAVTIVLGNRAECEIAVGTADPDAAADALLERDVDLAVVKLGAQGALVATPHERAVVPPLPIHVVSGLGAGDAFGGALCFGLLEGWSPVRSVEFANAAGALVASRLLCADAMPTEAEVSALLASAVPD